MKQPPLDEQRIIRVRRQLEELQKEYHKLVDLTSELVTALESSVKQDKVRMNESESNTVNIVFSELCI